MEATRGVQEVPRANEVFKDIRKLHINKSETKNSSRQSSKLGLLPIKNAIRNTKSSLGTSLNSNRLSKTNSINYVALVREDESSKDIETQRRGLFATVVNSEYPVEGARKFARCFIAAVKSFEETVKNDEARLAFVGIIGSLHKAWKNWMGLIRSKEDSYASEIAKLETNAKELSKQLKSLRGARRIESSYDLYKEIPKIRIDSSKSSSKKNVTGVVKLKKAFAAQATQCDLRHKTLQKNKASNAIIGIEKVKEYIKEFSEVKKELLRLISSAKENAKQDTAIVTEFIKPRVKSLLEEGSSLKAQLLKTNTENIKLKKELKDAKMEWRNEAIKNSELAESVSAKEFTIDNLNNTITKLETDLQIMSEHHFSNYKELNIEQIVKDVLKPSSKETLADWEEEVAGRNPFSAAAEADLHSTSISSWTISKPSYHSLATELYLTKGVPIVYPPSSALWLQVLIRRVFDSYYSEMLRGKAEKFPEFVFGWLSTYTVDPDSNKVRLIANVMKDVLVPSAQLNLVHQLKSPLVEKHWDTKVFGEFVNETSGLDELHFYLTARAILFRGSQMKHEAALTSFVHCVSAKDAFSLVDEVMENAAEKYRNKVKAKLIEHSAELYKEKESFDSAMVLYILLEHYRGQKKEKIFHFKEVFTKAMAKKQIPNPKANIKELKDIMKEALRIELTMKELANVYRGIYTIGRSGAKLDSILTAFAE